MSTIDSQTIARQHGLELLLRMKRIRLVEEAIAERYSEQKMRCPTHLSVGQEGVAAAAGLAMKPTDQVVSTHRGHAHYFGKGGDVSAMIAELHGKVTGCCRGKGGSMHLVDLSVGFKGSTAIVGNTIPVGVGLGLAFQLKKQPHVAGIFVGDAAIEEGVFYEAANFAVVRNLPVVFICENNLYSVYSPQSVRQPAGRNIHEMVSAMGMPVASGDGNDVLETYGIIDRSLAHVRAGNGPMFLEFSTYRWREHCGPNYDDQLGYRPEGELERWQKLDPIPRLVATLRDASLLSLEMEADQDALIQKEIDDAFAAADAAPYPDVSELDMHTYAEDAS